MLRFLQNGLGLSPSDDHTVFQCLGTFSRALEQPSFAPAPGRPKIVGDGISLPTAPNGGNDAYKNDDNINPSFLSVRVAQTFTRNDGTGATVGEPLVKKRFALNRLAWLTYAGPITLDGKNYNPNLATSYVNALKTTYGLSESFLLQGTPANIYKYFGLSWIVDNRSNGDGQYKWYYNHSDTGPFSTLSGNSSILRIKDLPNITTPREPDFIELLQAGVCAGSKAKPSTVAAGNTNGLRLATPPGGNRVAQSGDVDDFNNKIDRRLDLAILQMAANIIDQSKLDGFPTRILLNNATYPIAKEIRGVENLPYIYSLQLGIVQGGGDGYAGRFKPGLQPQWILDPHGTNYGGSTDINFCYNGTNYPMIGSGTITSTGFLVSLQYPEIWNPHDANSPPCAVDSAGRFLVDSRNLPLFPTSFRFVAESADPDHTVSGTKTMPTLADLTQWTSATYTGPSYFYIRGNAQTPGILAFSNPATLNLPGYLYSTTTSDSNTPLSTPFNSISAAPQTVYRNLGYFPLTAENSAMTFNVPAPNPSSVSTLFREPTLLMSPGIPAGSALAAGGNCNMLNASANINNTIPNNNATANNYHPNIKGLPLTSPIDGKQYVGVYLGTIPCLFHATSTNNTGTMTNSFIIAVPSLSNDGQPYPSTSSSMLGGYETVRLQYSNNTPGIVPTGGSVWSTYDEKYTFTIANRLDTTINYNVTTNAGGTVFSLTQVNGMLANGTNGGGGACSIDPRSWRFGMPSTEVQAPFTNYTYPSTSTYPINSSYLSSSVLQWLSSGSFITTTARPSYKAGYWTKAPVGGKGTMFLNTISFPAPSIATKMGWTIPGSANLGAFSQNDPSYSATGDIAAPTYSGTNYGPASAPQYYADPDGVVRKAMGAYAGAAATTVGLPLATAYTSGTTATSQVQSRPIVLHRPFRSVGELGYASSGTPWKNIDFFTPESGDCPLLDLFCISDMSDPSGMVAGKINLNTRQQSVIKAVVNGGYKDEQSFFSTSPSWNLSPLSTTETQSIATALINRTTSTASGKGPLVNISDLVGRFVKGTTYDGLSADLSSVFTPNTPSSTIQRLRDAPIRALSSCGQTRVWNLLIDVVAQTGRYPTSASGLDQFLVEGEQRYWVHVAIDRLTGQVIDKQVEVVKE